MNIYDSLLGAVHSEYDVLMLIKKSERGEVSLVPVSYTHLRAHET